MYIVIHSQTVSLYHSSSVWLDVQDAPIWDRNPSKFTLNVISYYFAISATFNSLGGGKGINAFFNSLFVYLHFELSDTGVPNSLEDICIMILIAVNSFAIVLNRRNSSVCIYIYIYIYILPVVRALERGIAGCHMGVNAKLFTGIEHSGSR